MLNQVVCSIVPRKGLLCGWMYLVVVLWMPRPTRAGREWFLTPLPTMGLPHGGGGYAIVFYNGCNTYYLPNESIEELWPMTFVLVATREHCILLVYVRIPPRLWPYTCQYTAVDCKYTAHCLH